jgi:uncharacterized damage-inducible protein DinB
MIRSMEEFLRYFDAVHRRTVRDIAALPQEAARWRPPESRGEASWDIATIVGHIAGSRLYFASAYRGEGWVSPPKPDTREQERWVPVLEDAAARLRQALAGTPDEWLHRRIRMIDSDGTLSGWRILMMMVEHEVHHRSQIDTYAGLEGWPVPDIFGRSAEDIAARQLEQRAARKEELGRP